MALALLELARGAASPQGALAWGLVQLLVVALLAGVFLLASHLVRAPTYLRARYDQPAVLAMRFGPKGPMDNLQKDAGLLLTKLDAFRDAKSKMDLTNEVHVADLRRYRDDFATAVERFGARAALLEWDTISRRGRRRAVAVYRLLRGASLSSDLDLLYDEIVKYRLQR